MVFIEVSVEIFSLLGCYAPLMGNIPKNKDLIYTMGEA